MFDFGCNVIDFMDLMAFRSQISVVVVLLKFVTVCLISWFCVSGEKEKTISLTLAGLLFSSMNFVAGSISPHVLDSPELMLLSCSNQIKTGQL